ncbi:MAG: primase-helicase family protein [Chitinophagaceae bacterium]
MSQKPATAPSYFEQRMALLGITSDANKIGIWQNENGNNIIKEIPVFTESEKGIDILVYTLDRNLINYKPESSRWSKNYHLTRLKEPVVKKDGSVQKYHIPKGQGTYPFFHPSLIEKFDKEEPIDTLFITEGFFKSWKGCMHGIPTVGLSSITHMNQAGKKELHQDIVRLIKACKTKRVVWLTDGDCLDITSKDLTDGIDLYKRPRGFFISCENFRTLLIDYDVDIWFFHIDSDGILSRNKDKVGRNDVKGLDDLLCAFPDQAIDIAADIKMVSKQSDWFVKHNISSGTSKILNYFHLRSPLEFYSFHVERRPELKDIEWVFSGTMYKWDSGSSDVIIKTPKSAKDYFRVGDQYYEFVHVPNKYGQLEKRFQSRQKGTIQDDHGRDIFKHISKYKAFCSVPDHLNFQQVINNCFNIYSPFEWEMDAQKCSEEDFPVIFQFVKHIFGEQMITFTNPDTKKKSEYRNWELGMDYLQLLLQKPTEKLPIICLVSRANNTGKSTFGKFLKLLFTGNVAIVGNQDLAGDFNAHWASKLLVICDETKIDKQHVIEKVKNLSTADKIMMNAKGKDHVELDCFIKFIFITNNEDSFINITEDDIRYWVLKVPQIKNEVTNMLQLMQEEIPAFLNFLNHRKLVTEQLNRMWFHPLLLKTDALRKVIINSQPTIIKELKQRLKDIFMDFGIKELLMTPTNIREEFFRGARYEGNYLERVLREELKCSPVKKWVFKAEGEEKEFDFEEEAIDYAKRKLGKEHDFEVMSMISSKSKVMRYEYPKWGPNPQNINEPTRLTVKQMGRPYRFLRSQFVSADEAVELPPEHEYINDMTPENHRSAKQQELISNDDLPF